MNKSTACCSFCQASDQSTTKTILIAGNGLYICSACVAKCQTAIEQHWNTKNGDGESESVEESGDEPKTHTPRSIKAFLDDYVIGQENAKVTISVAAYNHFKRINNPVVDDVEIEKSNILLLGPTGSGKTFIAQTLARCLDVPCVIYDATNLTETGYVGEDTDAIISRLLNAAGGDVDKAERGIIFIDEIDKKRGQKSSGRDVTGEGVQQSLLRLLEGTEVHIKSNENKGQRVNTQNILFILSGAFVGLDQLMTDKKSIGFTDSVRKAAQVAKKPTTEHLVKYGIIPELVGRLPVMAQLDQLNEEQLVQVLTQPKNAVTKQFAALFKLDGAELELTPEALRAIAKNAMKDKTGARGLRSVLEKSLTQVQYDLPELVADGVSKITLTSADNEPFVVLYNAENEEVKSKEA